MTQSSLLFKLAAVVSSILLVGGFVSYRAGAFDWLTAAAAGSADSQGAAPDGSMLSSSKSGVLFVEPPPQQTQSSAAEAAIIMGGSKSISIGPLIPPPETSAQRR